MWDPPIIFEPREGGIEIFGPRDGAPRELNPCQRPTAWGFESPLQGRPKFSDEIRGLNLEGGHEP